MRHRPCALAVAPSFVRPLPWLCCFRCGRRLGRAGTPWQKCQQVPAHIPSVAPTHPPTPPPNPARAQGLCTPREVFVAIAAEGYQVSYRRVPMSRERTPQAADLDQLLAQMGNHPAGKEVRGPSGHGVCVYVVGWGWAVGLGG